MKIDILNELNYSPTKKDLKELRHDKQGPFVQCDCCGDWFDHIDDLNYEGYCRKCRLAKVAR